MRRRWTVALLGLVLLAPPAGAQWAVIDHANLVQNTLAAARALQEINNQVTQIQQLTQSLQYQVRNLTTLPYSSLAQLQASMTQLTTLVSQAQRLSFDVSRLQQQMQVLYPAYDGAVTQAGVVADGDAQRAAAVEAHRQALAVQAQVVQGGAADQAQMAALVDQSQGAVGALQATQAGNQLLALQVRQLATTQDLLAANARAQTAEALRITEEEAAAQAEWRRFVGVGVGYTQIPVQVFGGSP
ncbi:P-type conjugative transfer protein TrbJ [Nitrospirillum bahiense]|uniref:P-type conjugative transfer protein TrbJ n=1 Tax=Nitrospirillum amazonense TaxID=28077 RepID=A0A560G9C9_9PROT|nr:P-type conjugative transfer protein TrbJ [Nitrospirillum amazonense]TWB30512.1 P-type conjugative transfer protein TrbJ [Nitrospirillum amazonense]